MKRDMNLVRKVLLFVEALPESDGFTQFKDSNFTERQVEYHAVMLVEEGLLKRDGVFVEAEGGISFICDALTYSGHDFLDAARDDTIWRKAMDKIAGTTGSVSIEVLKAVLIDLGKKALGLGTA
jgi:hypothetical protein